MFSKSALEGIEGARTTRRVPAGRSIGSRAADPGRVRGRRLKRSFREAFPTSAQNIARFAEDNSSSTCDLHRAGAADVSVPAASAGRIRAMLTDRAQPSRHDFPATLL
jgi:hypothetical protein